MDLVELEKLQKKVDFLAVGYPDVLDVVGDLTIEINKEIFFKQPFFPVLEFVRTLEKWDKKSNMFYNCIETDDNPLISFVKNKVGWVVKSPWQLFECKELISSEELLVAINEFMISVKGQLIVGVDAEK
jgi:hypothetical protein